MADLRTLKKHEVFLTLKRDLAMVCISIRLYIYFYIFITIYLLFLFYIYFFTLLFYFSCRCCLSGHQNNQYCQGMGRSGTFQCKDEEARRISTVKTLVVAEKRIKELNTKLTEEDRERKSAEAALVGAKKQVED